MSLISRRDLPSQQTSWVQIAPAHRAFEDEGLVGGGGKGGGEEGDGDGEGSDGGGGTGGVEGDGSEGGGGKGSVEGGSGMGGDASIGGGGEGGGGEKGGGGEEGGGAKGTGLGSIDMPNVHISPHVPSFATPPAAPSQLQQKRPSGHDFSALHNAGIGSISGGGDGGVGEGGGGGEEGGKRGLGSIGMPNVHTSPHVPSFAVPPAAPFQLQHKRSPGHRFSALQTISFSGSMIGRSALVCAHLLPTLCEQHAWLQMYLQGVDAFRLSA